MSDHVDVNCETGEITVRPQTDQEIADWAQAAASIENPKDNTQALALVKERADTDPAFSALAQLLGII